MHIAVNAKKTAESQHVCDVIASSAKKVPTHFPVLQDAVSHVADCGRLAPRAQHCGSEEEK